MKSKHATASHRISFDRAGIDACARYGLDRKKASFRRLLRTKGCRLAYEHYLWSNVSSKETIEEFWKAELERVEWSPGLVISMGATAELLERKRGQWLGAVLRYLPRGHVFDSTVYLIGGYDSVVQGEDVTLNMASGLFQRDSREAVYYLAHELAHAGYARYHPMPDLRALKTLGELVHTLKLLTQLEGMGVITPYSLRMKEGGLLDSDYKLLLDERKTLSRVQAYFKLLSGLEREPDRSIRPEDYGVLDAFSRRPKRLWYVAGGYMALRIEEQSGSRSLGGLVKEGPEAFFEAYTRAENRTGYTPSRA